MNSSPEIQRMFLVGMSTSYVSVPCLPYLCHMKVPRAIRAWPCMLLSSRGRYKWSFASSWAHGMISMGPSRSYAVCSPQYPHRWALEADIATGGQNGERELYAARFQSEWASNSRGLFLLLTVPRGLPHDQAWMCGLHSEKGRYFSLGSYENDTLNKVKVLVCFWMFIVGYVHIYRVVQESELTVMLIQVS